MNVHTHSKELIPRMPQTKSTNEAAFQGGKAVQAPTGDEEKALLCFHLAREYKASDIILLDVSTFSSFADYFLICSGQSTRQVQGIADNLERALRDHGLRPMGVEGRAEGNWVLMDYGTVIIHVFYEPVRHFYDLESLWSEAKRMGGES